ncbi:hypothetical protein TSA66_04295 [Noviherbaspirillum autotrophicum]|uniref:Uncharacterized protein n=1 Tax=Noviherbaspirillum autotrophicum TaxID=709839 RepID=A0A0C2BQ61_9BURK|nr:hypothetical protein TSA66_04295 [Noviherbaspirillum autotrophicum]
MKVDVLVPPLLPVDGGVSPGVPVGAVTGGVPDVAGVVGVAGVSPPLVLPPALEGVAGWPDDAGTESPLPPPQAASSAERSMAIVLLV